MGTKMQFQLRHCKRHGVVVADDWCAEWTGSRDSLLVAVTTAVWGSSDAQLVDMVRRLVYVALTQTPARLRERCKADFIDESDLAADMRDTGTGQASSQHTTTTTTTIIIIIIACTCVKCSVWFPGL